MRAAFGFGGQKCSANSRVYVERPVHDELVRLLVDKTEQLVVGNPVDRAAFLGPVIDQHAVDRHQQAVAEARRDGTVFTGGERLTEGDLARGFYVEPTVVGLPATAPPVPRRAVRARSRRSRRWTRSTRRSPLDQRQHLRPDGRRLLGGPGRGASGSSTRSTRASCTSTGGRARPPAPGRASRRSAAGRAPAPPASPACPCTTSRSSCASRATPSSTDGGCMRGRAAGPRGGGRCDPSRGRVLALGRRRRGRLLVSALAADARSHARAPRGQGRDAARADAPRGVQRDHDPGDADRERRGRGGRSLPASAPTWASRTSVRCRGSPRSGPGRAACWWRRPSARVTCGASRTPTAAASPGATALGSTSPAAGSTSGPGSR